MSICAFYMSPEGKRNFNLQTKLMVKIDKKKSKSSKIYLSEMKETFLVK